jgi:lipoyl(octanoyl) transferase
MSVNCCIVHCLGEVPYHTAWEMQGKLAGEIAAGQRPPALLLLEHPHTFTFGRRGKSEHLLWDEAELEKRGVSTYWVDRGGDITYHGPGQLVGYPLLPLGNQGLIAKNEDKPRIPQADYVGYVRRLEHVLTAVLKTFGIAGKQLNGLSGVWTENRSGSLSKIAAIGVKVDARGISRHGFALNVNPDMSYWNGIIGCGLMVIQQYR